MWWHILKVDQTADLKTVKRSYAVLLKDLDQDEDIDEFTNVNHAYREAIKSFKEQDKKKRFIFSGQSDRKYLDVLHELYNNPKKRLKLNEWQNIFDCMSFVEEDDFAKNFVRFFNEHYYLTDEVWAFLSAEYPLLEQKDFRWKDFCSDNFRCSNEEIDGLSDEDAIAYIDGKVAVFKALYNMDYDEAESRIRGFVGRFGLCDDMAHWYMVAALYAKEASSVDDYVAKLDDGKGYDTARFYYSAKLHGDGKDSQALEILEELPDGFMKKQRMNLESVIRGKSEPGELNRHLPWMTLSQIKSKDIKLLSAGNYKKVMGKSKRGKGSIFGLMR